MKKINNKFIFNSEFNLMKMLGIVYVVIGHINSKLLSVIRQPYTFHMPLFYFISGYFYNEEHEKEKKIYIWSKFKKNVGLYYFYYSVFILISFLIFWKYNVKIGIFNWNNFFVKPFTTGLESPGFFMSSAWFILSLFLVQVIFVLCFPLVKKIINSQFIQLIFFILLGLIAIYISNLGWANNEYVLLISRTFIGIMFYYMGYFYRTKIENKINIFNGRILVVSITLISVITAIYKDLNFLILSGSYGKHLFLPIITAVVGIYLSLFIAKGLVKIIKNENDILHLIGKNSFYVMIFHTFVFFIINFIYYKVNKISVFHYSSLTVFPFSTAFIDINKFWPLYIICGILLPTVYGEYIIKLKNLLFKREKQRLGV